MIVGKKQLADLIDDAVKLNKQTQLELSVLNRTLLTDSSSLPAGMRTMGSAFMRRTPSYEEAFRRVATDGPMARLITPKSGVLDMAVRNYVSNLRVIAEESTGTGNTAQTTFHAFAVRNKGKWDAILERMAATYQIMEKIRALKAGGPVSQSTPLPFTAVELSALADDIESIFAGVAGVQERLVETMSPLRIQVATSKLPEVSKWAMRRFAQMLSAHQSSIESIRHDPARFFADASGITEHFIDSYTTSLNNMHGEWVHLKHPLAAKVVACTRSEIAALKALRARLELVKPNFAKMGVALARFKAGDLTFTSAGAGGVTAAASEKTAAIHSVSAVVATASLSTSTTAMPSADSTTAMPSTTVKADTYRNWFDWMEEEETASPSTTATTASPIVATVAIASTTAKALSNSTTTTTTTTTTTITTTTTTQTTTSTITDTTSTTTTTTTTNDATTNFWYGRKVSLAGLSSGSDTRSRSMELMRIIGAGPFRADLVTSAQPSDEEEWVSVSRRKVKHPRSTR